MSKNRRNKPPRKENPMSASDPHDDIPTDDPELPADDGLEEEIVPQQPKVTPIASVPYQQVPSMNKTEMELTLYKDKMSGELSLQEVAQVQYGFLKFLRGILSSTDQAEVTANWNILLNFANRNKDSVFNEYHLFRGAEAWPGSQSEFSLLRRLMWLIIQTAQVKTRRGNLRGIQLPAVSEGLTEIERNALVNFYS